MHDSAYLTQAQMQAIVHNALFTDFDAEGRLRLSRFTAEQIADYAADGEGFPIRCRASANVTLDFFTDAAWFGFEYDVQPGSSQSYYGIDLLVDRSLCDSRTRKNFSTNAVLFSLPEGRHRVTVFLPWSAELMIKNMAVNAGATIEPVPPAAKQLLAIGDSITQGYKAANPSGTWVGLLTQRLNADILNLGVGGYGFYANSLRRPIPRQADLILLAYGTNDYSREQTADGFRQCAASYTDRLAEFFPHTPVLLILPIWRGDEKNRYRELSRSYTLEDAREILRDVAGRHPQITVQETDAFPHGAENFAPDYLHPNDAGFAVFADILEPAVRKLL